MPNINLSEIESGKDNTLPKILLHNTQKYGNTKIAMRKKIYGIWNEYSWEECTSNIKYFALGLLTLGLEKGDKICIIGDNDPEWYWAELAAQSMGGSAVGMYIDVIPSEIEYLVNHSESKFAVAKDQEQVDKFLEIKDKVPNLKKVIYWDNKGMWAYKDEAFITSFTKVQKLGEDYEKSHPGLFEESINSGLESDTAILCYTSGTSGLPKGVIIDHRFLINGIKRFVEVVEIFDSDDYLSFVPPAWIAEQIMGVSTWIVSGVKINFPEEPETVTENIKEIGPQFLLLSPGQWQSIISEVQMKISDSGFLKKALFDICMSIGYRIAEARLEGKDVNYFWKILYVMADAVCLRQVRDYLGLQKTRYGSSGGAPLGPDAYLWFLALGVLIKEGYALSEIIPVTQPIIQIKVGSVGQPVPHVDVRISDDQEIWLRTNDGMFRGYYKQPDETAKTMIGDWIHTGDAGGIDEDGFLTIFDRVSAMLKLKGGSKFSPSYIENRLKFSPYVKEVMVIGDESTDYIFALIIMDFDNVGKWAERNRIAYTTYADLSQKPEVYDLIKKEVLRVDKTLPAGCSIKRYVMMNKEIDADEGELTRTRKLRRAFLFERYHSLINAAYNGEKEAEVEFDIKYRDGRKGKMKGSIRIETLQ